MTTKFFELGAVASSDLKILDFWAPWCAPCMSFSPIVESEVAAFGRATLVKINVDEVAPESVEAYGITTIPALRAVLGGKVVGSLGGLRSAETVRSWLSSLPTKATGSAAPSVVQRAPSSGPGSDGLFYALAAVGIGFAIVTMPKRSRR